MIDIVLIAISAVTSLGTVWVVSRTRHGISEATARELEAAIMTPAERVAVAENRREDYRLLRKEMNPAPGSAVDWSLSLMDDEAQKEIARFSPPKGTSATSRGRGPKPETDQQAARRLYDAGQAAMGAKPRHDWGPSVTSRGRGPTPPPPTTGQWEPPDWAQTENVI